VFGTEQRDHLHARRVRQQIDRRLPLRVQSGVIRNDANAFATKWRKFLCFQHVEAGLHAACARGGFAAVLLRARRMGRRRQRSAHHQTDAKTHHKAEQRRGRSQDFLLASGLAASWLSLTSPELKMIFWNALRGIAL
jgi:hypothetical protein